MEIVVSFVFLTITLLLIWFLISNEKGPKEPAKELWGAFAFGILALAIAPEITTLFAVPVEEMENTDLLTILFSSLGVGFVEELFKFAPLAWYIYKKDFFSEHSDGIIYFAICGLTFGLVENITYTMMYGAGIGLGRIIFTPILHGASTGIVGYFLARQKVTRGKSIGTIFALIAVSLMHGLYNFGLSSGSVILVFMSIILTVLIAVGLFFFYGESKKKDRLHGLSAVGPNNFCKYCGKENIKRTVYCEYCGEKL